MAKLGTEKIPVNPQQGFALHNQAGQPENKTCGRRFISRRGKNFMQGPGQKAPLQTGINFRHAQGNTQNILSAGPFNKTLKICEFCRQHCLSSFLAQP